MKPAIILLFFLLLTLGCRRKSHTVIRGIYYWKTSFRPTEYEQKRMNAAGCSELYLRCFDVVKTADGSVAPVGVVRGIPPTSGSLKIIPVVYITQDALQVSGGADIPVLAEQIDRLLSSLWQTRSPAPEVQIDCDWTTATRDRYFALLRVLRALPFFAGKRLSCTIRLHQVKYQSRSGIPPVDRGLLMCYNMGSLKKPGNHNSILNPALAEEYLQHLDDYPLRLDVALPLFDWCLQFRDGKLRGIMRDVLPEVVKSSRLFEAAGKNLYACVADSVLSGYALRRGDLIRIERSEHRDVLRIANYVARHIRNDSLRALLFHCDSLTLAKHPQDELEAIYSAFD